MKFCNILMLSLMSLLVVSCDVDVDDQTIITASQVKAVNPEITERNFISINGGHKVLLAIMDTGIDYNHPQLIQNIHFSLDQSGIPQGLGWDYTGNDSWPAPFLARTNYFNQGLADKDRKSSLDMFNASVALIQEFPEMAQYFPVERNIEQESSAGVDHGTHVAGLASYDSPEIGLMSYRVVPLNVHPETDVVDVNQVTREFATILLKGLRKAIEDGATVINMSLGVNSEVTDIETKKTFFAEFKKDLTDLVMANPEVIFVVAAGNDGKWIDGTAISVLPCFIPKKNVICVSALTAEMEPADFTNIVNNDEITTIFAWGDAILSTVPGNTCASPAFDYGDISKGPAARAKLAALAQVECQKDMSLKKMSGTSMASPVIARKVAKLRAQFPRYSAIEIKEKLFESSIPSTINETKVWKLPIEKPSWYASFKGDKSKKYSSPDWNFFVLKK